MEDDEFLHGLKAITGSDATAWEGFDPSSWLSFQSNGEGSEAIESTGGVALTQDDDYASDDSAGMILNFHKLTPAEKGKTVKLSKARQFASEEVGMPGEVAELEKVKWKETGLAVQDVSPDGETFVAWRLVENYPDMFVGKANGVRAAPLFELDALHENRVWDLYYIHCPPDMNEEKAIVLVPTYQFEHLLDVVNAKLETRFTIPLGRNAERFNMSFGIGNSPRPRFLGRSHDAETFKKLCKAKAIPGPHPDDDLSKATHLGLEEFRELLKRSRADRKKGKKSDKNRAKRIRAHREWGRSVKRVQRYLGLRGRVADEAAGKPTVLDLSQPMVQGPEDSILFVAIDIEAWEEDHNLITEVGIATLDTTDIQNIAPGNGGENWLLHINARHIRVKENSWANNSRYVHGCANNFSFGESEFVNQSMVKDLIDDLIDDATFIDPRDGTTKQRPVVLVFHESSSDIKYLKLLSYYAEEAKNVVEIVDTREMHQYLVRSNDSASLGNVLTYLGISYRYLHNAGNDAVYTLQAMVALAVKKRVMSLEGRRKKAEGHVPYSDFKEKDGWTSGEDTDGGEPVGLPGAGAWGNGVSRKAVWNDEAICNDWGNEHTGQGWNEPRPGNFVGGL